MVFCVFMVRIEMKFVSMSTLIVELVSVGIMNMLRVMRMASCVERACFTGYLPACVHRMLTSAPKAWPSSSSHSITASLVASIVENVRGPCASVCLQTMPVDVGGDADADGRAGDALHGRTDAGPAFAHDVDHDVDDGGEADGDISMRDITTT